jgi:hypothetical protein
MRGLARFRRCDPPSPSMCAAASAPRPPPPRCRRQRPCRLVPKRKRRATTMDLLFEPPSPAYAGSPDISTHCRPTCRQGLHPHAPVGVGPAPRATPPPLPRVGQRFDKRAPLLVSPLWHFPFFTCDWKSRPNLHSRPGFRGHAQWTDPFTEVATEVPRGRRPGIYPPPPRRGKTRFQPSAKRRKKMILGRCQICQMRMMTRLGEMFLGDVRFEQLPMPSVYCS